MIQSLNDLPLTTVETLMYPFVLKVSVANYAFVTVGARLGTQICDHFVLQWITFHVSLTERPRPNPVWICN